MNTYILSKRYFQWAFDNPMKCNPNIAALYFYILDLNNRLGWKKVFGLPSEVAMEGIGVKSYNTYKKAFNDLVDNGFIIVHQKSKNNYTATLIEVSDIDYENENEVSKFDEARDKEMMKHVTPEVDIDKPIKLINKNIGAEVNLNNNINTSLNTNTNINNLASHEKKSNKSRMSVKQIKELYESEYEQNKENRLAASYRRFIDFIFGDNIMQETLKIAKMDKYVTFKQYEALNAVKIEIEKEGFKVNMKDAILEIHNNKREYNSPYIVIKKFIEITSGYKNSFNNQK